RAEPRHRLRGDLHRLAGLGVAAHAGLAVGNREFAEAGQPHLVPFAHLLLDRLQRRLDGALCLADAEPASLGDVTDQLILTYECHGSSSEPLGAPLRCGLSTENGRDAVGRYPRKAL